MREPLSSLIFSNTVHVLVFSCQVSDNIPESTEHSYYRLTQPLCNFNSAGVLMSNWTDSAHLIFNDYHRFDLLNVGQIFNDTSHASLVNRPISIFYKGAHVQSYVIDLLNGFISKCLANLSFYFRKILWILRAKRT